MLDPYFDSVVYLGAGEIPSKMYPWFDLSRLHAVTTFGTTSITFQDTETKWGGGSLEFPGGTSSYINFSYNANHQGILNGDFTIDCWVRYTGDSPGGQGTIMSTRPATGTTASVFSLHCQGYTEPYPIAFAGWDSAGTARVVLVSPTELSYGTWYHVAVTRNDNLWTLWIDGVAKATATVTASFSTNTNAKLTMGIDPTNSTRQFIGEIEQPRLTKGACRYTESFSPGPMFLCAADRGVTDMSGQSIIPVAGFALVPISGNATKSTGGPAEEVIVSEATNKVTMAKVAPDENGDWTAAVPQGDCYVTYLAAGCQPITHGPYTVNPPA